MYNMTASVNNIVCSIYWKVAKVVDLIFNPHLRIFFHCL